MSPRLLAALACLALAGCSLPGGGGPANHIPGSSRTFMLDLSLSGALSAHLTTATVTTGLSPQLTGRTSGSGLPCQGKGHGLAFILTSPTKDGPVAIDLAINGGSGRKRGAAISVVRGDSSWSTFDSTATFGDDGMSATLSAALPGDDSDSTERISGGWTCSG